MFLCQYVHMTAGAPGGQKKTPDLHKTGCELPDMNAGTWTQTLCRSSENSYLLDHLSIPRELLLLISPHTVIITLCAWVTVLGAGGGHWNRRHHWWGWVTPRPANRFPLEEVLTEDFCVLRTILLTLGSLKIKSFFHLCISMDYSNMIDFDCEEGQGRESATTLLWFLLLWNVFMIMATLTKGNV